MSRVFAIAFVALLGAVPPAFAGDAPVRVALDPGHGGADPGAEADSLNEAQIVLDFARRLERMLEATGRFDVVLTRTGDAFVGLDERLTVARRARAQIFLSLHADALEEGDGRASGVTAYTLADEDAEAANLRLTERHARDDLLSEVDLRGAEDEVAMTLIDIARRQTEPRSKALARAIIGSFSAGDLQVNRRPHRHGGYTVLKAADMPSVLIELGFLSSARDRERLTSEAWLDGAAVAIRDGLVIWSDEDGAGKR